MTPILPRRELGHTGLSSSPLGLGTVKWGRTAGLKHGDFELPDDARIDALLDTALELGVNVLDTAPAYGISESRLGERLGARRKDFLLFSKTGEIFDGAASRWDFSAEHTRRSVLESLRRLRTDALDAVLLHCPPDDVTILRDTPALETLAQLRAEGLVRKIGVSTMSLAGGMLALEHSDLLMVAWNWGFHEHQAVIEEAARRGVGVLLKKVFYSGHLPAPEATGGLPPAEYALRAALHLPGHPVVIVGTISPEHLRENAAAARRALECA